jgi:hypothetical protein
MLITNFETKLQGIMKEHKVGYSTLGRRLECSRQAVYNYAHGLRMPTEKQRGIIVGYLNEILPNIPEPLTVENIWPSLRSVKGRYHG